MTARQLFRLSGLLLLLGAILSIISTVVGGALFPDANAPAAAQSPLLITLNVLGVVGTMLALLGLPGLYVRGAREGGLLWLIGTLLIAVTGMLFGIFMGMMSVLVFPTLAAMAPQVLGDGPPPSFIPLFIIGTLANVVGALLMGIPMLTRSVADLPRWCGYLMILEAVLAALSFVVSGPSSSGLLSQLLNIASALPLFGVIGYAGYLLWSHSSSDVFDAAPSASPAMHAAY